MGTEESGVDIEMAGSKVGTTGRAGNALDLVHSTNITTTPIKRTIIMIASTTIRPT